MPTITIYYELLDISGKKITSKNLGIKTDLSIVTHNLAKGTYALTFTYYLNVTTELMLVRNPNGNYSYQYVTTGAGSQYIGTCSITVK